jgi:hypothetical protein
MRDLRARRLALLLAVVLPALLLAACVEWEEQEVRIAYDAAKERLDAQLVYRGLYSGAAGGKEPIPRENVDGTSKQLASLAAGKQLFALFDPITHFDLDELAASGDPRASQLARWIRVDHGDFFRDANGRLCGWQQLHVDHLPEFIALANELIREGFGRALREEKRDDLLVQLGLDDAESRAKQAAAVAAPFAWLALRGTTVALRLPASDAAVARLRSRWERTPSWNDHVAARRRASAAASPPEGDAVAALREEETRGLSEEEELLATLKEFGTTLVATRFGAEVQLELGGRLEQPIRVDRGVDDAPRFDLEPRLTEAGFAVRDGVDEALLAREFAWFRAK